MAATYAVLTLGADLALTKPQKILAYTLRYYVTAPKSAANAGYNQSISLADTLSRSGDDKTAIIPPVQSELSAELSRIFPTGTVNVTVTTEEVDSVRYNLIISPKVYIGGLVYSIDKTVTVSDGTLVMDNDTVTISTATA